MGCSSRKSPLHTRSLLKWWLRRWEYGERAVQLGGYPIGYCMVAAELKR